MSADENSESREAAEPRCFLTTHWSMVMAAAAEQKSAESGAALDRLCRIYWYPLYAFLRRLGKAPMDAEDLTQGFFARLMSQRAFTGLSRGGGKFRSYLLTGLKHFLINEREKADAQRRGGGRNVASLDAVDFEGRYRLEPADELTPEALFELRWAHAALDEAMARLQQEYKAAEKSDVFERLNGFLNGDRPEVAYAELAAECGTTAGAVKVAVHRLRRRYVELLRAEIARTVGTVEEVEEELRHLIAILRR